MKIIPRLFFRALSSFFLLFCISSDSRAFVLGGVATPIPPTVLGQVATATYIPDTISPLTTSAIMTRHCHYARDTITSLQLVYAGWASTPQTNNYLGAEISAGNDIQFNAWVEYPTGNPVGNAVQATCSASTSCTATSLTNKATDSVSINIPNNAKFCVWTYEPSGQHIIYTANFTQTDGFLWETSCGSSCEATNMGTSGVPSSPGAITDNVFGRSGITPSAIIAQTSVKSTYLLGDSRQQGVRDTADATEDLGDMARSVGPGMPYINGGVGGQRMSVWYWSNANQLDLAKYTSIISDELGINEFVQNNATIATMLPYKEKIAHLFATKTKPYAWTTIEPVTATTDFCATTGNQTLETWNADKTSFNDDIRIGGLGVSSYFELANPVEVNSSGVAQQDGGFWITTGYSNDCLHELAAGNALIVSSGNITKAGILASATPTTPAPTANATMTGATYDTSTPKFGSAALSGGYGLAYGVVPGTSPFTIGAWVKYAGTPAATNQWVVSTGPVRFGVRDATCFVGLQIGTGSQQTSSSLSVCDGAWHWIAVTVVATSSTVTTFTMYVDGVTPSNGTLTANMAPANMGSATSPFAIRTNAAVPGSNNWPGEVDDAAIFYGAITAVPSGAFTGSETGLIAAWGLNSNGNGIPGPSY